MSAELSSGELNVTTHLEIYSRPYFSSGRASRAGSKKFQEAQSILLSMKGKIAETMSFGSMENHTTEASSRRVRWAALQSFLLQTFLFYFTFLSRDLIFRLLELEE